MERLLEEGRGGVALADWPALTLTPALAREFPHVVLADPAPRGGLEAATLAGDLRAGGYVHVLGSHTDPSLSLRALELAFPLRPALADVYRALRGGDGHAGSRRRCARRVEEALGDARSPEWCGARGSRAGRDRRRARGRNGP